MSERSALFPLNTVLFPGCRLPLQIFEQRYLRLIKECLRDDNGFVVVLIAEGNEVGGAPEIFSVGTYVEITDWKSLDNGLLGVTITAGDKVHVDHPSAQHDGLLTAAVHPLAQMQHDKQLLDEYQDLADTLKQLENHPFASQFDIDVDYEDSRDVCHKLAYLLPISGHDKQTLLEITDTRQLCSQLRSVIIKLQNLEQN